MRCLVFSILVGATFAAKVKYSAETHTPMKSSGCGKSSPYSPGKTTSTKATYGGVRYTYRVYVPKAYNKHTAMPLVTQHPGWGMSALAEQKGSGVCDYADTYGYICVVPQGSGDNKHRGGPWYSWNAVGATQSPGPQGATCTNSASTQSYCYSSCGTCSDRPQCWWTTCHNEVTPTGTGYSNVNGYIPSLYDTIESQLCIDTKREYVAGESNGGMMTYQLAIDMSSRLAAAAPQFGSFHRGFFQGPTTSVPLIDIHGSKDTTVPANKSLSGDGYYYTTVSDIFSVWGKANGCSGNISHYKTPYDGQSSLYCVNHGSCSGGDLVRCSWNGGHNWFANSASKNGGLVSYFLTQWSETEHLGYGNKAEPDLLEDIEIIEEEEQPGAFDDLDVTLASASSGRYGNPSTGCLSDEEVIDLANGQVCAPKINSTRGDDVPKPACYIGGASPSKNGCPMDAPVPPTSKAFPVCLAKGQTDDPYTNAEFHCALACPCQSVEDDGCGPAANSHCPVGATCQRGELRNMGQGVCTYGPTVSIV